MYWVLALYDVNWELIHSRRHKKVRLIVTSTRTKAEYFLFSCTYQLAPTVQWVAKRAKRATERTRVERPREWPERTKWGSEESFAFPFRSWVRQRVARRLSWWSWWVYDDREGVWIDFQRSFDSYQSIRDDNRRDDVLYVRTRDNRRAGPVFVAHSTGEEIAALCHCHCPMTMRWLWSVADSPTNDWPLRHWDNCNGSRVSHHPCTSLILGAVLLVLGMWYSRLPIPGSWQRDHWVIWGDLTSKNTRKR